MGPAAEELRKLAGDAGLKDIAVRFECRTIRCPNLSEFIEGVMGATPPAGQFLSLPGDKRRGFVVHAGGLLVGYIDDSGLAVPQENHFLAALVRRCL